LLHGLNKTVWVSAAAVLLVGCAVGPKTIPMLINGRRMASFEGKGDHLGVTVFDVDGKQIR
jgi:hypothetical protein